MVSFPTFYAPELSSGLEKLDPDESRHCIRVLRKNTGDRIRIIDGKGLEAEYEIIEADSRSCGIRKVEEIRHKPNFPSIHIAIAPTKQMERMEWFLEKATEIGVSKISFLETSNSERRKMNMDRLLKKSITALKQSGNLFLPDIYVPRPLIDFLDEAHSDQKFIAHLENENTEHLMDCMEINQSVIVLIGPEGDFSPEEIQKSKASGFRSVSLGQSRLRTETAGLAACHVAVLKNR